MGKGPMRVKRSKRNGDFISIDPRISADRQTFSVRMEAGKATSWWEYLNLVMAWAHEEIKSLEMAPDEKTH